MSVSALGARALLFIQQTELEPQQDTCCVITQQQQQQQQSVSGSNLLAKRRTRSRNSNSSCYDLSPLSIPLPAACQTQLNSTATVTVQSEQVKHVQSVERDTSEIAVVCLRLMVMRRLASSEHAGQAEEQLMREAGNGAVTSGAQELPAGSAGATAAATSGVSTPSDTDRGVGGCACRKNERLARRLASMADEFGQTWCGRQAVDCASRMPLPPVLLRTEFDSRLVGLQSNASSIRGKIAFLLVLSAELAFKAVLLLNRLAVLTLLQWCQELLCSMASAIVIVRGWAGLLGDENGPLATVATVLALVLIGFSLARLFTRQCRN